MKKKGEFLVLFIFAILLISLVAADTTTTPTTSSDVSSKAYACLNNLVNGKCSSLSTEEKIFSLLAIQSCKSELMSDALANQCWPQTGCKIKTTSQAILALNKVNTDTSQAEKWLLSQTMNYPNIDWFLQVDANNGTTCKATYSDGTYTFSINNDKTLSGSAGSCLTLYNNYWLKVSPTCYDKEFQISCGSSFLTSLLYQKKGSTIVYVSDKTHSASGEGTTKEKVSSSCFEENGACTYEGTLWAALVMKYRGYDVSAYLPYLISTADDNGQYLPNSFLYSLTNNFRTGLLAQQQESKWWSVSGDKFYDTAVALLPFPNEQLTEKTNSINWLGDVQGTDGCWQDNIRNTAFILFSIWPKASSAPAARDCTSSSFYCVSSASCTVANGNVMANYTGCFGTNICCDKPQQQQSCSDQNGNLCDSSQQCLGGSKVSASDTSGGQFCCVGGTCGTSQKSECEVSEGICKSSCSDTEQVSSYSCSSSFVCCIEKPQGSSLWIIVVLAVLIVLVLIGIFFRKKLRNFFSKFRFGKGKGKPSPRFPPSPSSRVYPGAVQRRIIPSRGAPARRPVPQNREFDDVLKKLKEIGK